MPKQHLPVDPDIKIPAAVRKQAEQVEGHYKKSEPAPAPAPVEPPASEPPAPQPPAPEPAPEPAPAPAPAPVSDDGKEKNWEHAYKSMKGRYERSEEANKSLRARLDDLEGLVGDLRAELREKSQARATAPREESPAERLITEKEIEDYGPDLLNVVGKKAKEELSPVISNLLAEIEQLKGQLRGTQTQVVKSAREKLFEALDGAVPNWREINKDQDFLNWLDLPDRFSGAIRQELLNRALEQNDAPRVLAFFEGFLSEAARSPATPARSTPGEVTPPAVSPLREPPAPQVPLESLAAPGRAKSAAGTPPPVEKPTFTRAQISKFYADVHRGFYRGKEAEKDRLEAQIFEANREGRVLQ